ncbi:MAG: glycosyltransferase family 2 protein [Limisphaerales bacterium]
MPFFSIITVTLNARPGLARTLESILAQSFNDWELVIKDGGSTDGTREWLEALADPRIRVVTQPDDGIYSAMNQALRIASGRFVHFLNADDVYAVPEALAAIANAARANPNAGFIYSDYVNDRIGMPVRYPARLSGWFLFRNMVCHQAQFLSRELFDRFGVYDETLKIGADRDFALRVLRNGVPAAHVRATLVRYRDGGFSARRIDLRDAEHHRILRHHFSAGERLLFGMLDLATFRPLRVYLYQHCRHQRWFRAWSRIRNAVSSRI